MAHLGSRQRVVQNRDRAGSDGVAVAGGQPLERIEVAQGVGGFFHRQVGGSCAAQGDPTVDVERLAPLQDARRSRVRRERSD